MDALPFLFLIIGPVFSSLFLLRRSIVSGCPFIASGPIIDSDQAHHPRPTHKVSLLMFRICPRWDDCRRRLFLSMEGWSPRSPSLSSFVRSIMSPSLLVFSKRDGSNTQIGKSGFGNIRRPKARRDEILRKRTQISEVTRCRYGYLAIQIY